MAGLIPSKLNKLAAACPFPLYLVGGSCRDFLAEVNAPLNDFDICAPASAEDFARVAERCGFKVNAVYKNTGTVKLTGGGAGYEYAAFRTDEYVRGEHNPARTFFTDDILSDARRRDFKCNAVYYDIARGEFVDPLGGIADIESKRVSTVVNADKVFGEDGLRLMRLARFACRLGFTPDDECLSGARKNAALIRDISAERVFTELQAILQADGYCGVEDAHYRGIKILSETGVLKYIFPELEAGRGLKQRADFHDHDVLEHSLRCLKYADKDIRLAALLHDIGKPRVFAETGKFVGHEAAGADMAADILKRLRAPKKLTEEVCALVRLHMYDLNCAARESKVRRFIVENYRYIDKLLKLKQADYSACKDDLSAAPAVVKWRDIIARMKKEGAPFAVGELKTDGRELIERGVPASAAGKALNYLLSRCAVEPRLNEREKLLRLADEFIRMNFLR